MDIDDTPPKVNGPTVHLTLTFIFVSTSAITKDKQKYLLNLNVNTINTNICYYINKSI